MDNQRGKRRPGRRLRGATSWRAMRRRSNRDRAQIEAGSDRPFGAKLIPVSDDVAWKTLEERSFPGADGTFIHPFDDDNFIAGHGTMGLEILEDAPETIAVIASIGGLGLITGVGAAIKALKPETKIFGVEPRWRALSPCRSRWDHRKYSKIGKLLLSMVPVAKARSLACGNE